MKNKIILILVMMFLISPIFVNAQQEVEQFNLVERGPEQTFLQSLFSTVGCSETDNGKDYFNKGTTTSATSTVYNDRCTSSVRLTEYFCDGIDTYQISFECPSGCSNGECTGTESTTQVGDCIDSDGSNIFTKGYVINRDTGTRKDDGCTDEGKVIERICRNDGGIGGFTQYCPTGYFCDGGRCWKSVVIPGDSCVDTDGDNTNIKGSITWELDGVTKIDTDTCIATNALYEYTCSGITPVVTEVRCECSNGRCIEEPTSTITTTQEPTTTPLLPEKVGIVEGSCKISKTVGLQQKESITYTCDIYNTYTTSKTLMLEVSVLPKDIAISWFGSRIENVFAIISQEADIQICEGQENIKDAKITIAAGKVETISLSTNMPYEGIQDKCGTVNYWEGEDNDYVITAYLFKDADNTEELGISYDSVWFGSNSPGQDGEAECINSLLYKDLTKILFQPSDTQIKNAMYFEGGYQCCDRAGYKVKKIPIDRFEEEFEINVNTGIWGAGISLFERISGVEVLDYGFCVAFTEEEFEDVEAGLCFTCEIIEGTGILLWHLLVGIGGIVLLFLLRGKR